jgi:hypothetical protein
MIKLNHDNFERGREVGTIIIRKKGYDLLSCHVQDFFSGKVSGDFF